MGDRVGPPTTGVDRYSDERAVTPVVSKAMEAAIVVLYVGLVTAVLYGGVVPEYRATAGEEIAERTVADAATDVERAVPPPATAAEVNVAVELPSTIAGQAYRIRADEGEDGSQGANGKRVEDGATLVLEHPSRSISTTVPLVLPDRVVSVSGSWASGGEATVRVATTDDGLEVRLE